MRVNRIVVGLDGSDDADRALEWAATLARDLNADVMAVHAVPILVYPAEVFPVPDETSMIEELEGLLHDQWCALLRKFEIPFRSFVERGNPADVIMRVAEREKAQMIVVGSRGRGGFKGLLLGSVGQQLTQHANQAVVIVPKPKH